MAGFDPASVPDIGQQSYGLDKIKDINRQILEGSGHADDVAANEAAVDLLYYQQNQEPPVQPSQQSYNQPNWGTNYSQNVIQGTPNEPSEMESTSFQQETEAENPDSPGQMVGDGGFLVDYGAPAPQPAPREARPVEQYDEEEEEDVWVNDLGQLQGEEQLNTDIIAPNSTLGRRGNGDFDWGKYFGEDIKKPMTEAWQGDGGYLMGDASKVENFSAAPDLSKTGLDAIDNGTNTYSNRTSPFITGAEAKKQAEKQGLDDMVKGLAYVDDDDVLSKTELEAEYGYQSYVPDQETMFRRAAVDASDAYNQLIRGIGDIRSKATEKLSTVNLDGEVRSVEEVDEAIEKELNRLSDMMKEANGDMFALKESDVTCKETGYTFDGNSIMDIVTDPYSGMIYVQLEDGSSVPAGYDTEDGRSYDELFQVKFKPLDILGHKINFNELANYTKDPSLLNRINPKKTKEEQNEYIENSGSNVRWSPFGRASYATPGLVEYNDDGDISGVNIGLEQIADLFTQSASWFTPPTQLANMATGAVLSGAGVDPMQSSNDKYEPVGEYVTAPAAYLASAVGESTLGSVGANGGGVYGKLLQKMAPKASKSPVFKHFVEPGVSEAMEEVTMNPAWEYASNGAKGWYADDVYDENGFYTGEVNEDTPVNKRLRNAALQVPEGLLGGGLLGGLMGGIGGIRARRNGEWAAQKHEYELGYDTPEPSYKVLSPDVQRIVNHEKNRTNI
ncbi:MAG: hypothetical protein KBT28_01655 [Bacteroidales bacterium]|nr:hypothetical protein [Candidatus Colimorpha merdihippi]